jgi:hypothetical protein
LRCGLVVVAFSWPAGGPPHDKGLVVVGFSWPAGGPPHDKK